MAKMTQHKNELSINTGVLIIQVKDLNHGLTELSRLLSEPAVLDEIHIVLPDIKFLFSLLKFDCEHPAVSTMLDAWSIGITAKFIVHRQVLKLLSPDALSDLPLSLTDHEGIAVVIHCDSLINYADVALLDNCWVLAPNKVLLTDLAIEHMTKNKIKLVNRKGSYVSS